MLAVIDVDSFHEHSSTSRSKFGSQGSTTKTRELLLQGLTGNCDTLHNNTSRQRMPDNPDKSKKTERGGGIGPEEPF